ncbi:hypothetical protein ACERK3_03410 [Phycisphaerales bacterium AB-hyl4]|uniref:Tetratricopeptide repeat protein n=1 Tax=Natronomicrosphaera hydrolytica TaxID=3242702 RepID=A0ABV4U4D4_9BACT
MRWHALAVAMFTGLSLFASPQVRAQLADFDESMLIDAMTREGMSELLLHLVEIEPPDDPVVGRQIEVAQYRMRFDDANRSEAERREDFDTLVDATQQMIEDFYDHELRPVWQTDLTELLLNQALQQVYRGATFFYEFGVPTAEQTAAINELLPIALEAATDADQTFFRYQTELPRDDDHQQRRVNTGLWSRMMDDYFQTRTQYYLGQAAYLVALLPDDHPYYTGLGDENPRMPAREQSAEAERDRLLAEAVERLEGFIEGRASGIQTNARSLTARALMRQGEFELAYELFERTLEGEGERTEHLIAALGQAEASRLAGDYAEAADLAARLTQHPATRRNHLYRLLVADMQHRVLTSEAEQAPANQRDALRTAAYDPYLDLFDDPSLGDAAEGLRMYVFRRWVDTFADDRSRLRLLSPVVLSGIAEAARREGQNLAIEARQTEDADQLAEARDRLALAIEASQALHDSDMADDAPRQALARATYNEAVAMYQLDPRRAGNLLAAAERMTDVAERWPDQSVSEEAIGNAVALLRSVRGIDPRPAGADDAYQRAGEVLFDAFGGSTAADDERVYFGYAMLYNRGRFEDAAAMFEQVPHAHATYFEAQAARSRALGRAVRERSDDDRDAARERAVETATELLEEAGREAEQAGDDGRRRSAWLAVAEARLVLADMALDAGNADEALAVLEDFEQTFADEDVLVRDAMERRILALAEADRLDEASDVARQMMADHRDQAAAVIDEVLDTIDNRIEQANEALAATNVSSQQRALEQRISSLAETSVALAELLLNWAREQQRSDREMLPFELVQAKALRLADRPGKAVTLLAPRVETFGSNAPLLHEYAEALYAAGGNDTLRTAAGIYDRLIRGLEPPEPLWWNAWMRRLQINHRLGVDTQAIPLRVRQLRLRDENLGGARFRPTLESLETRHAR